MPAIGLRLARDEREADRVESMRTLNHASLIAFKRTLWTRCKVRKVHRCCLCRSEIDKGSAAFRPLRDIYCLVVRYDRICQSCADQIEPRGKIMQREE